MSSPGAGAAAHAPSVPATGLTIGLDARLVARGLGIATYVRELAHELVARDDVSRIVWFGAPDEAPDGPKVVACGLAGRPFPYLDSALGRRLVARHDVDVMHFAANTGWTTRGAVPMVLTVHDLIFLRRAGGGASARQRLGRRYMRWNVGRACAHADQVIAVSGDTASAIVEQAWSLPSAPRVVRHGARGPAAVPPSPVERRDFVIFGAADPRKNLALAIAAFEAAVADLPAGTELRVLAGAGLGQPLQRRIAASSAPIRVIGYLPRDEVWRELSSALALLHPTSAEGFGLPVIDAMAARTPVIGGLTAAACEIAGDAMLRLDAAEPQASLRNAMVLLAHDPDLRARLAGAGGERAELFSWSRCAEDHVSVYREAAAR
jgi:glycosyltransferase involved in cell wall biosynthesis